MRALSLAALLAVVGLGCETDNESCVQHGGVCAAICPANTEPLSVAQYSAVAGTSDYGCPIDGGMTGTQCCLPAPVTN